MGKLGEINYLRVLGKQGARHALNKPFSDPHCGSNLARLGAIMLQLPSPPGRLLDLGCGSGWTSLFLARQGYQVIGVDICPDMIALADQLREKENLDNLEFVVSDYEDLHYRDEFDAALFYDSLHHAVDPALAVQRTCQALRAGGVCITSEPGVGHADAPHSREAVLKFGVTERDMPPALIVQLGRAAGFRSFRVFPSPGQVHALLYEHKHNSLTAARPQRIGLLKRLFHAFWRRRLGIDASTYAAFLRELPRLVPLAEFLSPEAQKGGLVVLQK
jgi:SAM-dependent methyltransferase